MGDMAESPAPHPLQARIEPRLSAALGRPVRVLSLAPLAGGACQDNFVLEIADDANTSASRRCVLRSDALSSLPGSLDRRREFTVVALAHERGVRTAAPSGLAADLVRDGASGYLLEWVAGEAVGRKVTRGKELAAARETLAPSLAIELAKIHAITPDNAQALHGALGAPPADPLAHRLADFRTRIDALSTKRLGMELVYQWLVENAARVAGETPVLLHGDFRTGNFMVAEQGLSAILDWEFARWGSRYEDIAWLSLRDWRFHVLDKPIGGFASRADFYAAYEEASGHAVDLRRVHYYEVVGNLLWAIGSIAQAERCVYGGEENIEYLAIGRRVSEMEWEALRLIEQGALSC